MILTGSVVRGLSTMTRSKGSYQGSDGLGVADGQQKQSGEEHCSAAFRFQFRYVHGSFLVPTLSGLKSSGFGVKTHEVCSELRGLLNLR